MNDELIYQAKKAIMDYYDDTKYQLEIDCQEVLKELEKNQKDTTNVLKQFEDLIKRNNDVYETVMNQFNQFIENIEENLLNQMSLKELMDKFIQSTIYINRKTYATKSWEGIHEQRWDSEDGVGVFIHFGFHLNSNQLNLIKLILLRDEFKKDIKLCLNEVNIY